MKTGRQQPDLFADRAADRVEDVCVRGDVRERLVGELDSVLGKLEGHIGRRFVPVYYPCSRGLDGLVPAERLPGGDDPARGDGVATTLVRNLRRLLSFSFFVPVW